MLREARQARARREPKAKQQCYRQVLDLLHAETWDGDSAGASRSRLEKGVTGSRDRDRELEQLILTVLEIKDPKWNRTCYEILDTIAAGEFATVSRARDRELGREVAVKQIHPQYLADPRQLARYWSGGAIAGLFAARERDHDL